MDGIRTAVIGIGNMGSAHAACLYEGKIPGLKLAAVCDIDEEKRKMCRERFPDTAVYACVEDMLKDRSLQAAIVAVPHPSHAKVGIRCLETGLHTLVEKPLDVSVSAARRLCAAAEKSGRKFAVMLNQREDPVFQKAREIVRSGKLGELRRSVWIITNWFRTQHYYDSGSWRATWGGEGGGVLLNQAPHNLDLWQWICGMPKSVTAYCDVAKHHRIEVEDEAGIFVRYENGATGVLLTSTGEAPGTNRLEICGDHGKIVLENGKLASWLTEESIRNISETSDVNFLRPEFTYEEYEPGTPGKMHAGILENFANAILYGEELISPGQDGLNELTISNAAYLSSWQGGIPVSLPIDTDLFDRMLAERIRNAADAHTKHAENQLPEGRYSERWRVNWQ